jgi:hypothetical protein
MSNDEGQLLPTSRTPCPHCGADLESAAANGQLVACTGCKCVFLDGTVVSYRRCEPRGPAHGAADQEGVARGSWDHLKNAAGVYSFSSAVPLPLRRRRGR